MSRLGTLAKAFAEKLGMKVGDRLDSSFEGRAAILANHQDIFFREHAGKQENKVVYIKMKKRFELKHGMVLSDHSVEGSAPLPVSKLHVPTGRFSTRLPDPSRVWSIEKDFNASKFQQAAFVAVDDRRDFGTLEPVVRWVLYSLHNFKVAALQCPEVFDHLKLFLIGGQHSTLAAQNLIEKGKLPMDLRRSCFIYKASVLSDIELKRIGAWDNDRQEEASKFKPHNDMYFASCLFRSIYEDRGQPPKTTRRKRTPYTE